MSGKRKFIVDCDTGVDDAQAIMMLLAQPDVEILAITLVNGNCSVDQGCINTLNVLHVCDRLDIPVYRGARKPMVDTEDFLKELATYDSDGLGDADLNLPTFELTETEHAVHAIVRLVNLYIGEITLVTLAPLTNIALALNLDEDLGKKLKQFVTMGGNMEGYGSYTVSAEFNFDVDPYAAYVVLQELGTMITLIPFETCAFHNTLPWEWYDKWKNSTTVKGKFNAAIMKRTDGVSRTRYKGYKSCDPVAMAVAIDNSVATETLEKFCTVELHGRFTRSQMVIDWKDKLNKKHNVVIVKKYDVEKLTSLLEKATS